MENSKKRTISILALIVMAIAILVGIFAMPTQNAVAEEGIQPFGSYFKEDLTIAGVSVYVCFDTIEASNDYLYFRINCRGSNANKAKYVFAFKFVAQNGAVKYAYLTSDGGFRIGTPTLDRAFIGTDISAINADNDNSENIKPNMGQLDSVGIWGWIYLNGSYCYDFNQKGDDGMPTFSYTRQYNT